MVTEAHYGGPARHDETITLKECARIHYSTPPGMYVRYNEFDVNARTARYSNTIGESAHKTLALTRIQGQSFVIVKHPDVTSIDALQDLRDNGIQIQVNKVESNRQTRVVIEASMKWTVVRSELYSHKHRINDPLTPYHENIITSLDMTGPPHERIEKLNGLKRKLCTHQNELNRLHTTITTKSSGYAPKDLVKEIDSLQIGLSQLLADCDAKIEEACRAFTLRIIEDGDLGACFMAACQELIPKDLLAEDMHRSSEYRTERN
jgi:sRNA-binding carbon storage regulator CsrA